VAQGLSIGGNEDSLSRRSFSGRAAPFLTDQPVRAIRFGLKMTIPYIAQDEQNQTCFRAEGGHCD